jgi:hypothetical protein
MAQKSHGGSSFDQSRRWPSRDKSDDTIEAAMALMGMKLLRVHGHTEEDPVANAQQDRAAVEPIVHATRGRSMSHSLRRSGGAETH